jgi:mannose-1-phosphate guanylyltransferase/mannose-1-phosphate guanylyltransferase/mannose-6-phosphate isomerase
MSFSAPWVITNKSLRDLTVKNMNQLNTDSKNIILEPEAKNTAPAIALLCHVLNQKNLQDQIVGIFPADHTIGNEPGFKKAIHTAIATAEHQKIVTLGIKPDHPATGYGYIQVDKPVMSFSTSDTAYSVKRFHEKPSLNTANQFLNEGKYLWNAGIFVFQVRFMIDCLEKHQPSLWSAIKSVKPDLSNLTEVYSSLESISIDYAIMEKLSDSELSCVPCDIDWNDVGSWDAIAALSAGKEDKKTIEVRSKNNFIHSALDKTYAFVDANDLLVIDTKDALLIAKKDMSQGVKDVVEILKNRDPRLALEHSFEERPWGKFEVLKDTPVFKSKIIQVDPHQQISYQSHSKREEHWLITQGQGHVILDEKIIPVQPGTYVKIPLGAKHRIKNTGDIPIEFVEVQMGSYFGEDDIIRYQDDYARS